MNELMREILMLPEQASTASRDIDYLHYFVITVTTFGAVAVAVACTVFLVRYRQGTGRRRDPAPDRHPHHTRGGVPYWMELVVISGLLGLFLLWWVIGFRQYVRLRVPPDGATEIYVTAKQWMWSFAYPDGRGTNWTLYVPVGRPVKLVMTSRDVIHSFYVPEFRVKQDVVPGRMTTLWFEANRPGTFKVLCTEYCGVGHSTMRGEVVALPEADFDQWMQATPTRAAQGRYAPAADVQEGLTLAAVGERVATEHGCLRCHTVDGTPHIGPTWARAYGARITLESGEQIEVDEAYLTESMMDPLAKIHRGFQPVMPAYQGILTAGETGALVEYIRSLRSVPTDARTSPLPLDTGETLPFYAPDPGPAAIGAPPAGGRPVAPPAGAPGMPEQQDSTPAGPTRGEDAPAAPAQDGGER